MKKKCKKGGVQVSMTQKKLQLAGKREVEQEQGRTAYGLAARWTNGGQMKEC